MRLSAEALPFRDNAFDLVLFFEASYYVRNMENAFDELLRVLDGQGKVMFVSANPERPDFVRSPFSSHYHSADDFRNALNKRGLAVTVEGGSPINQAGGKLHLILTGILRIARRLAAATRFVPTTLQGRARLKRTLVGKLRPIPPEISSGFASVPPRLPIGSAQAREWKVLCVRAFRNPSMSRHVGS